MFTLALYVEVPQNIDEVKHKIFLGLTKRQLICFGIGGLIVAGVFYAAYGKAEITSIVYLAFGAAVPAIAFAFPSPRNGLYLEDNIKLMYRYRKEDNRKLYISENVYDYIDESLDYQRLNKIVSDYERSKR